MTNSGYLINTSNQRIVVTPKFYISTNWGKLMAEYPCQVYLNSDMDSILSFLEPNQQVVFNCEGTDTISVQYTNLIRPYMKFETTKYINQKEK